MEDTAIDVGDPDAVDPDAAAPDAATPDAATPDFVHDTGEAVEKVDAGESATAGLAPEPGHLAELPRSLAELTSVREGGVVEHRLALAPGATAAEVTAAMILMPPAAALRGHRADAEAVLVFHEPIRPPS